MKKLIMTIVVGAVALVGSVALIPDDAEAIPVFARKYGLACNSCHTMFPKLSKMGVAFRERGFRFAPGKEDQEYQNGPGKNVDTGDESPAAVFASNFPFTVRTQILYSGSGPLHDSNDQVVMPGHRFGMLDRGITADAAGKWKANPKIGFGEFGLISSGSYDNVSWWLDAALATNGQGGGISMLEGVYYFSDLFKVRVGRVQNDVGYGMTMMSRRPLGFGTVDAAQMAGGSMLMMGDGISVHGTTNGDSGMGTLYNFSAFTYGRNGQTDALGNTLNTALANHRSSAFYGRVAQEFDDNYVVGVYGYAAKNWVSDTMGGEAAMYMNMGGIATVGGTAKAMQFNKVRRYGVDFALNYGEPLQVYGAFTFGSNTNPTTNQNLSVRAFTVAGEWLVQDGFLLGTKWDYSQVESQMLANKKVKPKGTLNTTLYALYQIAQNVQGVFSFTNSKNLVTGMGAAGGVTKVFQQKTLNTFLAGVDVAL